MDSSQDHGAALHGSSSCQVRCCTVQRPQCALLSAADHPRRAGVERSTSSTSSFIASTGTAAVGRKPPAQLRRRADATAGHMGPVVIRADLVVPPVSAESDAVCVYRCLFFHFIDEYLLSYLVLVLCPHLESTRVWQSSHLLYVMWWFYGWSHG